MFALLPLLFLLLSMFSDSVKRKKKCRNANFLNSTCIYFMTLFRCFIAIFLHILYLSTINFSSQILRLFTYFHTFLLWCGLFNYASVMIYIRILHTTKHLPLPFLFVHLFIWIQFFSL